MFKAIGAATVILFEPSSERREIARTMGADYALDPGEVNLTEVVLELTKGIGAKIYLEAAGVAASAQDYIIRA